MVLEVLQTFVIDAQVRLCRPLIGCLVLQVSHTILQGGQHVLGHAPQHCTD